MFYSNNKVVCQKKGILPKVPVSANFDIINIAGTFALWEVVDLYLLERKVKRIEKYNAGQIATAEIIFNNESINELE